MDNPQYKAMDLWTTATSPIYNVLDDEGVNMENAQMRRIDSKRWVYADDVNGFTVLTPAEAKSFIKVRVAPETVR